MQNAISNYQTENSSGLPTNVSQLHSTKYAMAAMAGLDLAAEIEWTGEFRYSLLFLLGGAGNCELGTILWICGFKKYEIVQVFTEWNLDITIHFVLGASWCNTSALTPIFLACFVSLITWWWCWHRLFWTIILGVSPCTIVYWIVLESTGNLLVGIMHTVRKDPMSSS